MFKVISKTDCGQRSMFLINTGVCAYVDVVWKGAKQTFYRNNGIFKIVVLCGSKLECIYNPDIQTKESVMLCQCGSVGITHLMGACFAMAAILALLMSGNVDKAALSGY